MDFIKKNGFFLFKLTETELRQEVEKLTKRNAKLKGKLSADACKCNASQTIDSKDVGTMTIQPIERIDCSIDMNRLKIDRDFYQQEYMKLISKPIDDANETNLLRKQLCEKEYEIKMLRHQLDGLSKKDSGFTCKSVEAAIHRLGREKHLLEISVERLKAERNILREKLQITTSLENDQMARDECEFERFKQKIQKLENENLNLRTMQEPTKSTILSLKEEVNGLNNQITELTEENSKLRTSNHQLRALQEQTENSLIELQSRLTHSQRQLNHTETRLNVIDSSRTDRCKELGELRAEVSRLKGINSTLEKDKDRFIVRIDFI